MQAFEETDDVTNFIIRYTHEYFRNISDKIWGCPEFQLLPVGRKSTVELQFYDDDGSKGLVSK